MEESVHLQRRDIASTLVTSPGERTLMRGKQSFHTRSKNKYSFKEEPSSRWHGLIISCYVVHVFSMHIMSMHLYVNDSI